MGYKLALPIGTDKSWQVTLLTEQSQPVTTYTDADTLTATVWAGADQPALFFPTVTWVNSALGTVRIAFLGTDTQGLDPGQYTLRLMVNTVAVPDNYLVLEASPGVAGAYTSYCSHRDMLDYLPSVDTLQDSKDTEGYARQRQRARTWTDNLIQRNRANAAGFGTLGLGGPTIYGFWSGWYQQGQDDPILQGYLDDDQLIVTPTLVEMNAKKALSFVCLAQIGLDEKSTTWQRLGEYFKGEADRLACCYTAMIDRNADGFSDITIPIGRATNR